MTEVLPPWVIQASSHPADTFRRQSKMLALGSQGTRLAGDLLVTANGSPNMTVNVAAGEAMVNGTQNATSQGAYECLNDATVNRAIAASDPTNPRIDIVVAQVRDAVYSGANNDWILAVVTGTPAPSPSPPATPANAIVLAQVAVAANAVSITSGNITDKRPFLTSSLAPTMKAIGGTYITSTPGLNGVPWLMQAGSTVITLTASAGSITFPAPFPTGILTVIACAGDNTLSLTETQLVVSTSSLSAFTVNGFTNTGASVTGAVRINWIAIGW